MKSENINVNIQTNHNLTILDLNELFCAYKYEISFNETYIKKYGLCLQSEKEEMKKNPYNFKSKISRYYIWKREVIDVYLKDKHHFLDNMDDYYLSLSDNFEKLSELDNFNEYTLLLWDGCKEFLYEYNNEEPLPHTLYFNYINGNISNSKYNLEEVIKILEQRSDIVLEKNKNGKLIHEIPYYNVDYILNKTHYLSFKWIPSKEDWKKVLEHFTLERYGYTMSNIFKINSKNKLE